MATTNTTTTLAWEKHSRTLRSALDLASSAAEQTAELAFHLEAEFDLDFTFPADLVLVYHCVVSGGSVEARVFLDCLDGGQEPGELPGVWRPFSRSPGWDGTVESTIAVLRGDELSDIVCNVRLGHYMSQATLAAKTSLQGDAA